MRKLTLAIAVVLVILPAPWCNAATPDKLLPDDAHVVVSLKLKDFLATEFGQKYGKDWLKNLVEENALASTAATQLGFDPAKDLDSIVVASRDIGVPSGNDAILGIPLPTAGDSLVLLRGRFDVEHAQSTLNDLARDNPDRIKASRYQDFTLYAFDFMNRPMVAVWLDKGTLAVATTRTYLTDAIDRLQGKKKSELDKGLAAAIGRVDDQCLGWIALGVPGWIKDVLAIIPGALDHAEKLNGITVEFRAEKDVTADLNVQMLDKIAAEGFRRRVNQGKLIFAALALPNPAVGPTIAAALARAKATVKEDTIVLHAEITPEMVDRAINARARRAERRERR